MSNLFAVIAVVTLVSLCVPIPVCAQINGKAVNGDIMDYSKARYRELWIHHPVIGDPSWDSFEREPGNPIYTSKDPMLWTVNGFIYQDPPSGKWYSYLGLYPRGYWPCGDCLVMKEKDKGGWEEVGLAVTGDAKLYDGKDGQPGFTPDVSIVYDNGRYHMVYDWGTRDLSKMGTGYAWSDKPEGPYHRTDKPVHSNENQTPFFGRYKRTYAATLIKRQNDWMVLAMMDSIIQGWGCWALAAMTSKSPEGPYTEPKLLVYPQSERFHPPIVEFFPAFVHDGYIYSPATSVALNRTFQAMFKAPIEKAHDPESWSVDQCGSMWHMEPVPWEALGIWGQTFAGQVSSDGNLRVLYPCKTKDDIGTISIAKRKWDKPYKDGFVLSAPNAPAVAVLRKGYSDFSLDVSVESTGSWVFCWDCKGPLGPDRPGADSVWHSKMRTSRIELRFTDTGWKLVTIDAKGQVKDIAAGDSVKVESLKVERTGENTVISIGERTVWTGKAGVGSGRLELIAETGTVLKIDRFQVTGKVEPVSETWLCTEALIGGGANPNHWKFVENDSFKYGFGYISTDPAAFAKWNFNGSKFRLYAPKGPDYGICKVIMDGTVQAELDLKADTPQPSQIIFEKKIRPGYHALSLRSVSGSMTLDVLEVEM